MKKYLLQTLVVIMSFSLIGIIIVQLFWIKNAIDVKENQYEENIRKALENIIQKIERRQAVYFISNNLETFVTSSIGTSIDETQFKKYFKNDSSSFFVYKGNNHPEKKKNEIKEIKIKTKSLQRDSANVNIVSNNHEGYIVINDSVTTINKNKITTNIYIDVFEDMVWEFNTRNDPITKRIDQEDIDSLIKKEVIEKGFDNTYEYAIIDTRNDSINLQTPGFTADLKAKSYKTTLFPDDIVDKNYTLYLYLPNKTSFIYKSIIYLLSGSVLFTLVIIVIFYFTTRIAFRQKKISEIKSDFINNMTHEFKTPIATISLATDSIRNPKIISDHEKINHYLNIIKEENKRMNNQVESVLQMSLLEKDKFKINLSEFDLHDLIQKAVKNIQIQINERKGKLSVSFEAENPFVLVDETHFLNIIHNLLDNALKYSKEIPEIRIKTFNQNGNLKIIVSDSGIGIKKDDLVRIFDKFYRVSTGNIHNVKGFGLGLSYVKAIVTELNGTIHASSEFGTGTTFEITLPAIQVNNGK